MSKQAYLEIHCYSQSCLGAMASLANSMRVMMN